MAQVNNYIIADGDGLTVLNDLTATLQAVRDDNAGATAPSNPVPGMRWRDTSGAAPVLRIRNVANSGWETFEVAIGGAGGFGLQPIGIPFGLWDHITGCPVPSNTGTAKFIKLTAGLIGSGQYNNGLLGSESVSGSAPSITATATILVGPMTGQTVALVNTEQAFIRPRTTSGLLQSSEIKAHNHSQKDRIGNTAGGNVGTGSGIIDNEVFGTATDNTGGDETRPRNRSASFYLRIV